MGNVNVSSGRSTSDLSQFQINKLTFDFNTFFDLNNPGEVVEIGVVDARDFLGDCLLPLFWLAIHLKDVHGSLLRLTISK